MNPAAEPIEISNRPVAALRAWLAVAGIPEGTVSRAVTPYSGPFGGNSDGNSGGGKFSHVSAS
jgi:hypothetical protein